MNRSIEHPARIIVCFVDSLLPLGVLAGLGVPANLWILSKMALNPWPVLIYASLFLIITLLSVWTWARLQFDRKIFEAVSLGHMSLSDFDQGMIYLGFANSGSQKMLKHRFAGVKKLAMHMAVLSCALWLLFTAQLLHFSMYY